MAAGLAMALGSLPVLARGLDAGCHRGGENRAADAVDRVQLVEVVAGRGMAIARLQRIRLPVVENLGDCRRELRLSRRQRRSLLGPAGRQGLAPRLSVAGSRVGHRLWTVHL